MAINANALSKKTTPSGTDDLLLFDDSSNSGTKIDYDDLADAILNKLTSKTYANQVGGSSAATLLAQLATLNSNNQNRKTLNGLSVLDKTIAPGVYYGVNMTDAPSASSSAAGWIEIAQRSDVSNLRKVWFSHFGSNETYLNQTDPNTGKFKGWVKLPSPTELGTQDLHLTVNSKMNSSGSYVYKNNRTIMLFLNGTITAGSSGGDFVTIGTFDGVSDAQNVYYFNAQVTQGGTPILFRFNVQTGDVGYYCASSPSGMVRSTLTALV